MCIVVQPAYSSFSTTTKNLQNEKKKTWKDRILKE